MPPNSEVHSEDAKDCEELSRVLGRLEASHPPLLFPGRLIGGFRSIVEAFILSMENARYDFLKNEALIGTAGYRFVRFDDWRCPITSKFRA
jgi:hypothetical protein